MKAAVIAFALALAAAGVAQAQDAYVLDSAHSHVGFSIERFGFNRVIGRFDGVAGEIRLDQAHPENSSVTASIQIASISSGDATRDEHLRGERWLNAAQFPAMTFASTAVRPTDATHAEVTGNLTLMGQTHPVTLDVTLNRIGELPNNRRQAAGFTATGVLARAQWGVSGGAGAIGADVAITIEALGVAPQAGQ